MTRPGLGTELLNSHFIHFIDSSTLLTNKWLQFAFTCKILHVKCFPSSKYIWEMRGKKQALFYLFFLKLEKSYRCHFNWPHCLQNFLTSWVFWIIAFIDHSFKGVKVNFWVLSLQKSNFFLPILFFFISVSPSGCEYIPRRCWLYAEHRCLGLWQPDSLFQHDFTGSVQLVGCTNSQAHLFALSICITQHFPSYFTGNSKY